MTTSWSPVLGGRPPGEHREDFSSVTDADPSRSRRDRAADADPLDLTAEIVAALGTADVDLVDLARASALLRFAAGRD